jgi:predicted N-acetyltransferase YhbS
MAVHPAHERRGVGHALLDRVCRDLTFAELDRAVVSWVGPTAFYERAGATVRRTYRVLTKTL